MKGSTAVAITYAGTDIAGAYLACQAASGGTATGTTSTTTSPSSGTNSTSTAATTGTSVTGSSTARPATTAYPEYPDLASFNKAYGKPPVYPELTDWSFVLTSADQKNASKWANCALYNLKSYMRIGFNTALTDMQQVATSIQNALATNKVTGATAQDLTAKLDAYKKIWTTVPVLNPITHQYSFPVLPTPRCPQDLRPVAYYMMTAAQNAKIIGCGVAEKC